MPTQPVSIGEASKASGVSAKTIRHYESTGLLPVAPRTAGGYRLYTPNDLANLRFIRHARNLGFSLDEVRDLLGLWHDRSRPSRDVKALARRHMAELEAKVSELQRMKASLASLVEHCRGDDRPECPIIDGLAS